MISGGAELPPCRKEGKVKGRQGGAFFVGLNELSCRVVVTCVAVPSPLVESPGAMSLSESGEEGRVFISSLRSLLCLLSCFYTAVPSEDRIRR